MKADTITFFEFLEAKKINFIIPVYQRNYEWTKEQCSQLFNDIEAIIADDFKRKHFLGTIVYVYEAAERQSKNYIIIDGQQRITSFMLLLKGIAKLISDDGLKSEIEEDYLINPRVKGENRIKLKSVEKDRLIFNKIIENKEIEEISKVYDNYKIFIDLLKKSNYELESFFEAMSMIEIVYIELNGNDESENPQIIFESINSTGLSLTASDLIRNFLLMGIDSIKQHELYNDYWKVIENRIPSNKISSFIRFYLHLKLGSTVFEKRVYEEYKRFFNNNQYDPESAIRELEEYSKYYYNIVEEKIENRTFNRIVKNINIMKATVIYPYLMELLKFHKDGIYTWEELNEIITLVQSYLYRRTISEKPTNSLNKLFPILAKNMSKENELERITDDLINRKGVQVFPRDEEFINAFETMDIYNRRNNIAKLTLSLIETKDSKELISFENIQVEHIMPQTLNDEWRLAVKNAENVNQQYGDTIGNLTLTGYNSEISNKSFYFKKEKYEKSNISITREVAEHYKEWSKGSIQSRSKKLVKEALEIWPFPQIKESKVEEIISGEYSIEEMINVTNTKPQAITLDNKEISINSWTTMLIEFMNFVWEYDSATFDNLQKKESLRRLFRDETLIISPKELSNGMIVETNFSANDILSVIRIVAKEYEIEEYIFFTVK